MTTGPVRRRLRITGRVQGVFFRASTREVAEREGITGWVRNNPDGSVEVEVQGPPSAVEAVVAFCRQGPPQASVTAVDAEDLPPVDDETSFEAR